MAKRSWDYSTGLFNRTFREFSVTAVDGEEAGIFPFDLTRVQAVMDAIVHALAFRDFGRTFIGEWHIFCATLLSRRPTRDWDKLRHTLAGARYDTVSTPAPDVFQYGIRKTHPIGFICRLTFYAGFVVFAWPVINTTNQPYK